MDFYPNESTSSRVSEHDKGLSAIDTLSTDVAIVDIGVNAESDLKLTFEVKRQLASIDIVAFTSEPDDAELFQVLKTQAVAYLAVSGSRFTNGSQ